MKGAFEKGIIDDALHVPDRDSVEMVREINVSLCLFVRSFVSIGFEPRKRDTSHIFALGLGGLKFVTDFYIISSDCLRCFIFFTKKAFSSVHLQD
jgi:hypothetical protein